jgi:hypothetical protein
MILVNSILILKIWTFDEQDEQDTDKKKRMVGRGHWPICLFNLTSGIGQIMVWWTGRRALQQLCQEFNLTIGRFKLIWKELWNSSSFENVEMEQNWDQKMSLPLRAPEMADFLWTVQPENISLSCWKLKIFSFKYYGLEDLQKVFITHNSSVNK